MAESELDDAVRPLKIRELKSEGRRGRSEYGERTPHSLRVARIGIDPDVDILRTARNTVYGQRVRACDENTRPYQPRDVPAGDWLL